MTHILDKAKMKSHEKTEQRLIRLHNLQPELFGELTSKSGLIEKAYDLQSEKSRIQERTINLRIPYQGQFALETPIFVALRGIFGIIRNSS